MTGPDEAFEVQLGAARFDPARRSAPDEDEPTGDAVSAWLVQLVGPLQADDAGRLRGLGLRLREYVPPFAYIERLPARTAVALRDDPRVRAVVELSAEMKVAPAATRATDDDAVAYRALAFEDVDAERIVAQLAGFGATEVRLDDRRAAGGRLTVRFVMDAQRLADVAVMGELQWIEPLPRIVADSSPGVTAPGQAATAEHAVAWSQGLHGEGQVIGVIDDGPPATGHCFFRDATDNTPGSNHRKVLAVRNAAQQGGRPHATFVAGCAAGDQVDAPGQAADRGGAWAAKLVLGNFNDMATFGADPADNATSLHDELSRAAAAGATIHTNSWHAVVADPHEPAPYDLLAVDVDAFTWAQEEQLVLGAAGNSTEQQGSPGTAKNAICVSAATAAGTALGDGAPGPTTDGRHKPDLMMVGCGVRSALSGTACDTGPRSSCASSYATPLAAAAAALLRQYLVEGRYPSGKPNSPDAREPSGALLKALLIGSTDSTATLPDVARGWGTVRLGRSIGAGSSGLVLWDVPKARGLAVGERRSIAVDVVDGDALRVVLTWTEPPGTPGAATAMVNELALAVAPPAGPARSGEVLRSGVPVTQTAGVRDNVASVTVDNPTPGRWTVTVEALMVNVGDPGQGFAVVALGATPVAEENG